MAHMCAFDEYICIGSMGSLKVFSVETGACVFFHQHDFDECVMDGCNNPLDQRLEDLCTSSNGKYICAVYSDKTLVVFDASTWTLKKQYKMRRRPTAVTFDITGSELLVADKSGDLYKYVLEGEVHSEGESEDCKDEDKGEIQPILGHVSMLLDVKVTANGKYILTADRDEKIRVSEFDHPFVIHTYCLGHTEFVCSVEPVPSKDGALFLSTSGDGTIRLWSAESGTEYMSHIFAPQKHENGQSDTKSRLVPSLLSCAPGGDFFVVASDQTGENLLSLFKIDNKKLHFIWCSNFTLADSVRIADLAFNPRSDKNLFVMTVSKVGNKIDLLEIKYQDGIFSLLPDDPSLRATIEAKLKDFAFAVDDSWSALFKARCEGEAYASYHKKKEERLAKKTRSRNGNGTLAKREKVDQQS